MTEQIYLLTAREFILLAATAGIRELYGFDMSVEELDRGKVIYVLQDLTKKGYLKTVEREFYLTEVMAGIFTQIKNAESVVEIHKRSGRRCMLYMEQEVVMVSETMYRKNVYKVSKLSLEKVWNTLVEEGWIPGSGERGEGKSV